jgi:hypothetical protein
MRNRRKESATQIVVILAMRFDAAASLRKQDAIVRTGDATCIMHFAGCLLSVRWKPIPG